MNAKNSLTTKLLAKKDLLEATQMSITTFYTTNVSKEGKLTEVKFLLEQIQKEIILIAKIPLKALEGLKKAKANVKPLEYVLEKSKRYSKIKITEDLLLPKILSYINYIFYLERYYDERSKEFDTITRQFRERDLKTIKQSIQQIHTLLAYNNAYIKVYHLQSLIMLANLDTIVKDLQQEVIKRTEIIGQKKEELEQKNKLLEQSYGEKKLIEEQIISNNTKGVEIEKELEEISKKILEIIQPNEKITKFGHEVILEIEKNKEMIQIKSLENTKLKELLDTYNKKIILQQLQENQIREEQDLKELTEKILRIKSEIQYIEKELLDLEKELEKRDTKEYIKNIDEITKVVKKAIMNMEYLKKLLQQKKVKEKELKIIKDDIWEHVKNNLFSEEKDVQISTKYLSYIAV